MKIEKNVAFEGRGDNYHAGVGSHVDLRRGVDDGIQDYGRRDGDRREEILVDPVLVILDEVVLGQGYWSLEVSSHLWIE